jgi:hypothetical protein
MPLSLLRTALLGLSAIAPVSADLRPLSTDRPDTTESPYTVDAGHYQFEMEIGSWTRDGREREYSLGELNAKVGLDDSKDLQFVLPFFSHVSGGEEGFGDIEVRLKWNLWGDDSDSTAFAIMPFLKLPTAHGNLGNGQYEGGLILPFAFKGPAGWDFGTEAEFDLNAGKDGDGYHPAFLASFTSSHDLTEKTGVFLELVSILSADPASDWEAYFNTGLTWEIATHWQLDGGVRIGLTGASTDFTPFLGASAKF